MDLVKRKFYLQNSKQEKFNLLGQFNSTPFLYEPSNLGHSFEIETVQVGNEQVIVNKQVKYDNITCDLIFSSYEEYDIFVRYVSLSNDLRLYYITDDDNEKWYYEVDLLDIDKGEKEDINGLLICSVIFLRKTNKKNEVVIELNNRIGSDEVLETFPLPTKGSNFIKFGGGFSSTLNLEIYNDSPITVPTILEMNGGIKNPSFINRTNGNRGSYSTPSDGMPHKLVIDSTYPKAIILDDVNSYEIQQFGLTNFLYLSPGLNEIEISLTDLGALATYVDFSLKYSVERYS